MNTKRRAAGLSSAAGVRGRHDGDGLAVPQGQVDFVKRLDQRPRRPGHNGRFQLLPGAFIFDGVSDLHGGFLLLFHAPFGRRGRKYQYCYQDPPAEQGQLRGVLLEPLFLFLEILRVNLVSDKIQSGVPRGDPA